MTKTTKQILTEARDMALIPGKLSYGALVSLKEDGSQCHCTLGLIALAIGYKVDTITDDAHTYISFPDIDANYTQLDRSNAVQTLANVIRPYNMDDDSDYTPTHIVYRFNDVKGRQSPTLVVDMLNKAIELADA